MGQSGLELRSSEGAASRYGGSGYEGRVATMEQYLLSQVAETHTFFSLYISSDCSQRMQESDTLIQYSVRYIHKLSINHPYLTLTLLCLFASAVEIFSPLRLNSQQPRITPVVGSTTQDQKLVLNIQLQPHAIRLSKFRVRHRRPLLHQGEFRK